MKLQPCPFCGAEQDSDAGPIIYEYGRTDKQTRNRLGKIHKRVQISHCVQCMYCGAQGPDTIGDPRSDAPELTKAMIESSKQAAAFEWNKRQPINDRAYALVNKIIDVAIKTIGHDENGNGTGTANTLQTKKPTD